MQGFQWIAKPEKTNSLLSLLLGKKLCLYYLGNLRKRKKFWRKLIEFCRITQSNEGGLPGISSSSNCEGIKKSYQHNVGTNPVAIIDL